MKITILIFSLTFGLSLYSGAQEILWKPMDMHSKHLISVHVGADFGTVYGLSYGYRFSGNFPFVVGTEISFPFGNDLIDDWKIKLTGQSELWHNQKFSLSVKPGFVVRRYESDMARVFNFGTEIGVAFGYYPAKWGVGVEGSFDKAIVTHMSHNRLKDYYPEIQDGWYLSSGGSYKFGFRTSYAIKGLHIFLKAGKIYGQQFKENPTLPFYFDISLSKYL
jgi:hypothetical protein